MIIIDGNFGEAGGQIVRTALALSTITGKPFEVNNIRKGRCSQGLKNQHLYCVKALEELCDAKVGGASLGSEYLKYSPGEIKPQTVSIDVGTAGSITLLLQSLLMPCFFSGGKVRLKITGGTDTKWSMPVDYFKEILVPQVSKFCESIDVQLIRRGYFPKGNGKIDIKIKSKFNFDNLDNVPKINLMEQGHLIHVKGVSHASLDLEKANAAERQANAAKLVLSKLNCPINIQTEYSNTLSTGSGITLWAVFSKDTGEIDAVKPLRIGADSLGEQGKRAEIVGKEAAERLINEVKYGAPVDEYLADNLIPFLGLFKGRMKVAKISNHTLTNIYVVEQFLGEKFEVDKEKKIISVN